MSIIYRLINTFWAHREAPEKKVTLRDAQTRKYAEDVIHKYKKTLRKLAHE